MMYAVAERYAGPEMDPANEAGAPRGIYAGLDLPHRWPRLVREAAAEGWPGMPAAAAADSTEPLTEPEDELFLLGERCAEAYMQADALHYHAMVLLAEFDHRSGWQDTGFSSTAEWLAWRIGIQPGAARERVRTALALERLPLTSEAMRNGELSFTKVRALSRVATPDNESTLLDFARAGSAANLERVVRGWKTLDRKSEVTAEQIRHRSRRFSAWVDDDGMVVVRGRLDPEVGAMLMRAVEAASDALYREEAHSETLEGTAAYAELDKTKPEQRRADAVGLLAERALAAGFGNGAGNGNCDRDAPISGSRAERYQVMLHVDAETLRDTGDPGLSELEDGTRVSAETSRRLACDASLVTIALGPDGQVLGAGRKTRTVPPSVRRALEARDRGCRFPGCGSRFTEAHHVKHWADGGETSLRNTALLCRRHHRAVHEGSVQLCLDVKGQVVFFTPRGKALLGAPPAGANAGAKVDPGFAGPKVEMDLADERPREFRTGHLASHLVSHLPGASRWTHDRDIPWEVEARAWEVLDSG